MTEESLDEWERQLLKSLVLEALVHRVSPSVSVDFARVNDLFRKLSGVDKVVVVRNG